MAEARRRDPLELRLPHSPAQASVLSTAAPVAAGRPERAPAIVRCARSLLARSTSVALRSPRSKGALIALTFAGTVGRHRMPSLRDRKPRAIAAVAEPSRRRLKRSFARAGERLL